MGFTLLAAYPLLFAATAIWCASATAQVTIDTQLFTCRQYLDQDLQDREVIAGWMSGYINAAKGQNTVDIRDFERNRALVDRYCSSHKLEALMNAI